MARAFGTGEVLGTMTSVVSDHSREVGIFTAVIGGMGVLGILAGFTQVSELDATIGFGTTMDSSQSLGSNLYQLVAFIVSLLANFWLLREMLRSDGVTGGGFWTYLGMSIVAGIGVIVGMILLIVPGIFVLVRWSAANGYVVRQGMGAIDSLKASWQATSGHGLAIFLAGLILVIGLIVVSAVLAGITALMSAIVGGIIAVLLNALGGALALAFSVGVYRLVSDGAHEAAAVFE